jgi:myo-inositol-1(or 4)-monophosphatase
MLTDLLERQYLSRIRDALIAACELARQYVPGSFTVYDNGGRNVVTEVDRKLNDVLRCYLLREREGWLSEEDVDVPDRLTKQVVWAIDPLDGTREFVDGVPEWAISVGLIFEGMCVAGGVCNPATNEFFLGGFNSGVMYNGRPTLATSRNCMDGAIVLASRQEYKRGEWAEFEGREFWIRQTGSVAYKLALVSAGLADATWTLSPKREWDVAAGVALVRASGGRVAFTADREPEFNRYDTVLSGLVASRQSIWDQVAKLVQGRVGQFRK